MNEETGWVCTEPEPTADTHRTVRIWATMETELYLNINVPINIDDDEVYEFVCNGNIDGGDMVADTDPFAGGWTWNDVHSVDKFDPTATDYSEEILES
jgi:hypothetical protein